LSIERDPMFVRTVPAKQFTHGVEQSRQSVDGQAKEGILERRQRGILQFLADAGPMGMTALEIEKATGEGHGKVSGALSAMHREGMVVALKLDRRNGYGVYVLERNVQNRLTRDYQPIGKADQTRPAPIAAPSRPRLTSDELALVAAVRGNLNASPDSVQRLKPTTARALLAALDRLNA